jgi:AI-2 transport protein TqsA
MTIANDPEPTVRTRSTTILVGAAAAVVLVAGLKAAGGIVGPTVLALSLTIVFHPLRVRLERRMPSWAASLIVLVGVYALVLGLVLALVVSLGRFAVMVPQYETQLDQRVADVGDWLTARGVGHEQAATMVQAADPGRLVGLVTSILSGVLGVVSNLFFLLTLLLFMTFDGAEATRLTEGARRHRPHLVNALGSFAQGTRTYLGVSAIFGLIVAVIDTGALLALDVPGAFIWGVLAFITNFIPNIGFVIGLIPPALVGLLEGGPGLMILVIVLYCLINFVIQSIIQPRYVGNAVGLSTTLTFLSLVFWTWVIGPLGAILAVPLSLFFKAVLVEANPLQAWLNRVLSGRAETWGEVNEEIAKAPKHVSTTTRVPTEHGL